MSVLTTIEFIQVFRTLKSLFCHLKLLWDLYLTTVRQMILKLNKFMAKINIIGIEKVEKVKFYHMSHKSL